MLDNAIHSYVAWKSLIVSKTENQEHCLSKSTRHKFVSIFHSILLMKRSSVLRKFAQYVRAVSAISMAEQKVGNSYRAY